MLWLLRRFIDSIARGDEEVELRRLQDDRQTDHQPDGGGRAVLPDARAEAAIVYVCRVCDRRSHDGDYCVPCLAQTMVKAPPG